MNLPNAITVGRIATAPFIAALPFFPSWKLRLLAWVLFILAAVTDYVDGTLARSRGLITNLGTILDPLADKVLLVATLVPMYVLQSSPGSFADRLRPDALSPLPFVTLFGVVTLPWWVVAIVLGRELFMTVFRQMAAHRGVVISAIGPAKWKTGFQSTWVGIAFFWFWSATAAATFGWDSTTPWRAFAIFAGTAGTITMSVAVALTVYSLALYLRRYGSFLAKPARARDPA